MRSGWVLATLLTAAVAVGDVRADGVWTDRMIDGIRQYSLSGAALHLDTAGHPHVFVGGDRVYHEWFDGSAWQREIVDSHARSGRSRSVATRPSGEFHVVYERSIPSGENPLGSAGVTTAPTSRLFYATNLSGEWVVQQIPSPNAPGTVSGLVVDASHAPHFLTDSPTLSQETLQNGTWVRDPIADLAAGGFETRGSDQPPQLAIDGAGDLHAVYYLATSGPNPRLVYSKRDGSGWHSEVLDSVNGTPISVGTTEILLDPAGNPHILTGRQYLSRSSSGWSVESVPYILGFFAAAFDSAGELRMMTVRSNGETDSLTRTDGGWSTEASIASLPTSAHLSLGVDSSGGVHAVALTDGTLSRPLIYLHRSDAWTSVEIDRTGNVSSPDNPSIVSSSFGAGVRMALANGQRRLIYRAGSETAGGFVRQATEQEDGFAIESVPGGAPCAASGSGHPLALALAPDGSERAAWTCSTLVESTRASDGTWTTSIPTTEGADFGHPPAVAFDAQGAFHSVYAQQTPSGPPYLLSTFNLRHAVDTTTRLSAETIAQVTDQQQPQFPEPLAIAVGPLGSVVVAYLDSSQRVVEATNATGSWVTSVVGVPKNGSNVGSYALLVEPGGTVHMAFEDAGGAHALVYGSNRCGGWVDIMVDPLSVKLDPYTIYGSRNPDLTLDSIGNPHISYRRQADHSLGYAHIQGGAWTTETVESDTTSGESSAIAVDGTGVVSIAHHDTWDGDLHLATRETLPPEPAWDGCPPLPDPNALQQGFFVFAPPAAAVPFYDPTGADLDGSVGALSLTYSVEASGGRRLFPFAVTMSYGSTPLFGSDNVAGVGKISTKRGQVEVLNALLIQANSPNEPKIRAIVGRSESIDPATGARSVEEILQGRVDGKKVTATRSFGDQVPASSLGLHLYLQIGPGRNSHTLFVQGGLQLSGGVVLLTGKGQWNPATATADVQLTGSGARFTLHHLHVWKSEADGVHLSAGRVAVSALGQKFVGDLTGSF